MPNSEPRPSAPQTAEPRRKNAGPLRLWRALGYSLSGLRAAFAGETAFRQEVLLAAILVPLSFLVRTGAVGHALLVGSVLAVLVVELLNSAIEAVVDLASPGHHPLAKRAKDVGSAAVLLALGALAATWALIILG